MPNPLLSHDDAVIDTRTTGRDVPKLMMSLAAPPVLVTFFAISCFPVVCPHTRQFSNRRAILYQGRDHRQYFCYVDLRRVKSKMSRPAIHCQVCTAFFRRVHSLLTRTLHCNGAVLQRRPLAKNEAVHTVWTSKPPSLFVACHLPLALHGSSLPL